MPAIKELEQFQEEMTGWRRVSESSAIRSG
jgi:hypothetical protein